jgi:hypothetical protein
VALAALDFREFPHEVPMTAVEIVHNSPLLGFQAKATLALAV